MTAAGPPAGLPDALRGDLPRLQRGPRVCLHTGHRTNTTDLQKTSIDPDRAGSYYGDAKACSPARRGTESFPQRTASMPAASVFHARPFGPSSRRRRTRRPLVRFAQITTHSRRATACGRRRQTTSVTAVPATAGSEGNEPTSRAARVAAKRWRSINRGELSCVASGRTTFHPHDPTSPG
jgi:hypothetical protein